MAKTKEEEKEKKGVPIPLIFGGIVAGAIFAFLAIRRTGGGEDMASLYGTVTDITDNEPIPGATVEVVGFGSAGTNIDGDFALLNIPPDYYTIIVSAPGYEAAEF